MTKAVRKHARKRVKKMTEEHNHPGVIATGALPCPFCGSTPHITFWHGGGPQKRLIHCNSENCWVEPSVTGSTRALAIDRWNVRS